jgi:hypothetical protein
MFIARKLSTGQIVRYISLNDKKIIIIIIIIIPKPNIFTGTRTQDSFRVCDLSSCNLLAETNNFVLYTILLCLVSKLLKTSSSKIEPRTVSRGCGLCFCNVLFQTNNFGLGIVLISCLGSELQETTSPGLKLRTLCGVLTFLCSLYGLTV